MSLVTEEVFDPKHFVDIDNVRIIPPQIEFKNGFEGRNYRVIIKIQNISTTKAFVRITPPSSYAFKIKAIPHGMELSPGLSIVRSIRFTYTYMIVQLSFLPIYINDKHYDIQIIVRQPTPDLRFYPDVIDFGTVDAGCNSVIHTLVLKNIGSKATRFSVDLTRNMHQISVEPNKGVLPPKSSTELRLRLMASIEGQINPAMWIKCDTPVCVPIRGTVILPKFEAIHPNATESFTVLDFPITYVGVKHSQTILIRNCSQSSTMFCVLGEVKNKCVSYETAKELNSRFKHFEVYPLEGSFHPHETKIFHVTFFPKQPTRGENIPKYYLCLYQISKIPAKYLQSSDYTDDIFTSREDVVECGGSTPSRLSFEVSKEADEASIFSNKSVEYETRPSSNFVRIYVHAVAQVAKVTVVPDQLHLANVVMKQKECRVLEFTNNSDKLPIIVRYKKTAYITTEKPSLFLKPAEIRQTTVTISSQKIGVVKSKIDFDLLFYDFPKIDEEYKVIGYLSVPIVFETLVATRKPTPKFNPGIVPKYLKEVGTFCSDIRFNSSVEKPKAAIVDARTTKSKDDLIAFPNDMQRSIRPWRNPNRCTTIFTRMSRYIQPCNKDYELTVFDREFKMEVSEYYHSYLRKEAGRVKSKLRQQAKKEHEDEYTLTNLKLRLCADLPQETVSNFKLHKTLKTEYCLPLTPAEMNKIIITPQTIKTGKIVAHHKFPFQIHISNNNNFSIRVVIKPDKPALKYPGGHRKIIGKNSVTDIDLVYVSPTIGYYSVAIDLIINESMVFIVTLLADVSRKALKLNLRSLEFQELESSKCIDIYNPLNMHINFYWNVQQPNIVVEPEHGCVEANKCLTCLVSHLSHVTGPGLSELEFNSGDTSCQLVRVIVRKNLKFLFFPKKYVNLGHLPLNMPVTTEVIIQNVDSEAQSFTILDPEPIPGVTMEPKVAAVQGNSDWICYIHAQLTSCIHFRCTIKVEIEKCVNIELVVEGDVIFPNISIIPKQIAFKKIPVFSFDVVRFAIENKSIAVASVKIDMSMYPEFKISESRNLWGKSFDNEIILDGKQTKILFMHFKPMYVTSGSFYLPIIVNNILGPPISTDLITTKVGYFLNTMHPTELARLPPQICCAKIQCYVTEPKLRISKSDVCFQYNFSTNSFDDKYFKISNTQREPEEFCIRTDDLKQLFTLSHLAGKEITVFESSILCNLNPKENVTLKASFTPIDFGDFQAVLPVYLRSDMSTKVIQYICLQATYPKPEIIFDNAPLYMTAIPLKVKYSTHIYLTMKYHKQHCFIQEYYHLEGLMLIYDDNNVNKSEIEYKISYTLRYIPNEALTFNTHIGFQCSCGCEYQLPIIGCAENCLLTNYAFIEYTSETLRYMSINFESQVSFADISTGGQSSREIQLNSSQSCPSFPDFKNVVHLEFMNKAVKATELWISKQAFFGKLFFKIPEGLSYITFKDEDICIPPFAQLLINLGGPQMRKLLSVRGPPKSAVERVLYVYAVYERALNYLKRLGAFCPQVQLKYLLGYASYNLYTKHYAKSEIPVLMEVEEFISLSTQTWLDVILQTYKVLILYRLNIAPLSKRTSKIKNFPMVKFHSIEKQQRLEHVYSEFESTLLHWLEFHFNDMRSKIWEGGILEKEIVDFKHNYSDGLVFAAVTAAYCPYLISHFKNCYVDPNTYEENLHNAIKVTQAWNMIHFSFNVSPTDITNANSIQILMLVTYLYEVLPTMYPTEVIEFKTGLSLKATKSLKIKNINNFTISYEAIFFNNEDDAFNINESTLVLDEEQHAKLSVQYHAKFLKHIEAVLVLSGECCGFYYAKSKAVTLIGNPDVTYISSTMTIPTYLYKVYDLSLVCKSPYASPGYYNLRISHTQPQSIENVHETPYITNIPKMSVNRVTFKQNELFFDENGIGTFNVLVCGLNPLDRILYLYFTNEGIGSFAIQINAPINLQYKEETIDVVIPKNFSVVTIRSNILNVAYLNIPCQNRIFWDTVKQVLLQVLEGEELEFWKKYIYTPTGIHILRDMLSEHNVASVKNICQKNKEYKMIVPRNACAILPEHITLDDECSLGHVKVPITFKSTAAKNFSFVMESTDGLLRRMVGVNFIFT